MSSTDQFYVIAIMISTLFAAAWMTSDTESILIKTNKVQAERIVRQEVYVDTLISWVEECLDLRENLPKRDSLNLEMSTIDSVKILNLQYRNYNLQRVNSVPGFKTSQEKFSKKSLTR